MQRARIATRIAELFVWLLAATAVILVSHEWGHVLGAWIVGGYAEMILRPEGLTAVVYPFVPQGVSRFPCDAGGGVVTIVFGGIAVLFWRWRQNPVTAAFLVSTIGAMGMVLVIQGPDIVDVGHVQRDLGLSTGLIQLIALLVGIPFLVFAAKEYFTWLRQDADRWWQAILLGLAPLLVFDGAQATAIWALWAVLTLAAIAVIRLRAVLPIAIAAATLAVGVLTAPGPLRPDQIDGFLGASPSWARKVTATHVLLEGVKWAGPGVTRAEMLAMVQRAYPLVLSAHQEKPTDQTRNLLAELSYNMAHTPAVAEEPERQRHFLEEALRLLGDTEGYGHITARIQLELTGDRHDPVDPQAVP